MHFRSTHIQFGINKDQPEEVNNEKDQFTNHVYKSEMQIEKHGLDWPFFGCRATIPANEKAVIEEIEIEVHVSSQIYRIIYMTLT